MLPQHVLIALVAAVGAVPLNINLGAYSPALVVGDGEISLGSTESASQLMATLASGAAEGQGQGQQQGQQPPAAPPAGEQRNEEQPAEGEAAKRGNLRRAIESIIKREAVPEPEPTDARLAAVESAMEWIKRDLAGFNAALSYAREAQKDQPKVELGSEGAGVGIVVNPGINVPQNSAAAGSEKRTKRGEVVEESESPKMTLVAITEV